jgi:AcrR family transcriptional regulator
MRARRLDADGRRRLLEVAIRQFGAYGYERASLNEIIAETGLSKGSFYHHYEDKRALFLAALSAVVAELYAEVPLPPTPKTRAAYWPTMRAHMTRMVAALRRRPLFVAFFSSFRHTPLTHEMFDPARAEGRALYLPFLRAGQTLGCVRDDVPLETLARIWETTDAALDQSFMERSSKLTADAIAAHAELAFDLFRRVFEARPVARKKRRRA